MRFLRRQGKSLSTGIAFQKECGLGGQQGAHRRGCRAYHTTPLALRLRLARIVICVRRWRRCRKAPRGHLDHHRAKKGVGYDQQATVSRLKSYQEQRIRDRRDWKIKTCGEQATNDVSLIL